MPISEGSKVNRPGPNDVRDTIGIPLCPVKHGPLNRSCHSGATAPMYPDTLPACTLAVSVASVTSRVFGPT
jgi:hypothetical protein